MQIKKNTVENKIEFKNQIFKICNRSQNKNSNRVINKILRKKFDVILMKIFNENIFIKTFA